MLRFAFFIGVAMAANCNLPMFREWQKIYMKSYEYDSKDENIRLKIYCDNLKRYAEWNAEEEKNGPDTARYGPDEYSDLTIEEWKEVKGIRPFHEQFAHHGPAPDGQCNFEKDQENALTPAEIAAIIKGNGGETIDWRTKGAVTGVKNQGSYGTCGYFATICVMEGINVIGGNNSLESISEQENIDCCTKADGCTGWPGQEIDWYKKKKFFASTESSYPYKGATSSCKRSSAKQTKGTSSGKYCTGNGADFAQTEIMAHLIRDGPAVWMMGSGGLSGYRGGVITNKRGSPGTYPDYSGIDHATTLVGAGESATTNTPYWIVKNSWGSSFGEKGYYRVVRGGKPPALNCPGGMFGIY